MIFFLTDFHLSAADWSSFPSFPSTTELKTLEVPDRPSKPKAMLSGTKIKVSIDLFFSNDSFDDHFISLENTNSLNGRNEHHGKELTNGICLIRLMGVHG